MAKCPKCGRHLHLTDISQFCPGCGVNMRFYGFEENFYKEAKIAELAQAGVHIKIRRLKASFVGSKLCIVRLVVMLLPLVSLLLANGKFTIDVPFKTMEYSFGALGLYGFFTGGGYGYVNTMIGSSVFGISFGSLLKTVFVYASVAVFAVLVLLLTVLCFISYKNMQKIISVFACLGFADSLVAFVTVNKFSSLVENSIVSGTKGFGLLLTAVMFACVAVVNILLSVKGIPVEYDEGMLERAAIYKKVRSGKINIDDLPQPVVETEATRQIEMEILKEEEAHRQKNKSSVEEHANE